MSKILFRSLLSALAVACCTVQASEVRAVPSEVRDLRRIMAVGQECTHEALAAGLPIYASSVTETDGRLLGRYANGSVVTRLEEQPVQRYYFGRDGEEGIAGESKAWHIESVGGLDWVVFYHDGFRVYSRAEKQFVIVS